MLLDCVAFNKQSVNITSMPEVQAMFKTLNVFMRLGLHVCEVSGEEE